MPRKFTHDAAWNLAGQLLPAAAALVALPILLRTLGTDRLGVLSLAWAVVGYFGIFDLGVGRAITHFVAATRNGADVRTVRRTVTTGLAMMLILGIGAGALLATFADDLCYAMLAMPDELRAEAVDSMRIVAIGLPIVLLTIGFRAILEGLQAFRATNTLRIPIGLASFLVPALLTLWWPRLSVVVAAIVSVRAVGLVAFIVLGNARIAGVASFYRASFDRCAARTLLSFGGWVTVSNVLTPLMSYVDRFLIGALVSVASVAYYATVFDVMTKALLLPAAVAGVLFSSVAGDFMTARGSARLQYRKTLAFMLAVFAPVMAALFAGAHVLLSAWLGQAFADAATPTARILAVGVLANGLAHLPFAALQASRRPDLTAKTHMLELPCYLVLLALLVPRFGIEGAAAAWTLRVGVDAAVLFWLSRRAFDQPSGSASRAHLIPPIAAYAQPTENTALERAWTR